MMKILHFNTYEKTGGAPIAASRLHRSLLSRGVESLYLYSIKHFGHVSSDNLHKVSPGRLYEKIRLAAGHLLADLPTVKQRLTGSLDLKYYYTPGWFPGLNVHRQLKKYRPDIIHLHWISMGFIRIESLSEVRIPIVWTLHDSWAFTGGCHIPYDCKRYTDRCGKCPALSSSNPNDISAKTLSRKFNSWKDLNITLVAPSNWLAKCARKSRLFSGNRIETIPHGIDTDCFKPIGKKVARRILNFPDNKKLLLFGAVAATIDINKGFGFLKQAMRVLRHHFKKDDIELVIFGAEKPVNQPDLYFNTHYLGFLHDDISLKVAYSAADVMVVPSIQEAFGLTAVEAMACGTPVVAFNTSGLADIVNSKINGYLADPFDATDLADGIMWVIEDADRLQTLAANARQKTEQSFSSAHNTEKYAALYDDLLH